jgi:hypothetical protein
MDEQYVEATTGGRIRALVPSAVFLLAGALMYWLAGIIAQRHEAELANYSTGDYRAVLPVVSQHLLEVAWLRFLIFLAMAAYTFGVTRAIQVAGRWPIPNQPVLFRTRVRTNPRYIKGVVVLGYVTSGLVLLSGLLGFYAWYSFRDIFH